MTTIEIASIEDGFGGRLGGDEERKEGSEYKEMAEAGNLLGFGVTGRIKGHQWSNGVSVRYNKAEHDNAAIAAPAALVVQCRKISAIERVEEVTLL
eukprot:PDM82091.1 hypothetical protein PRIPAC_36484 [Pristionchus pacificus]